VTTATPTPTDEQQAILDMAYSGPAVLEVLAGAGTGKTRSVTWVGDMFADYGVTGIYLALNRSVADEVAGKFTRGNVAGMTVHSLAFRIAGRHPGIAPLLDRVGHRGSVAPWEMAKHFRFRETFTFTAPADVTRAELTGRDVKPSGKVKSNAMMKAALATLRQWCATALDAPDDSCVPRPSGMGDEDFHGTYAPRIIDLAGWLWTTDICSPWGELTFTHDYYLKMVSLTFLRFSGTAHCSLSTRRRTCGRPCCRSSGTSSGRCGSSPSATGSRRSTRSPVPSTHCRRSRRGRARRCSR
jgi:hypothetical protein